MKRISWEHKLFIILLSSFILLGIFVLLYRNFFACTTPQIRSVTIEDNKVNIKFYNIKSWRYKRNKIYCLYTKSKDTPTPKDTNWKETKGDICSFDIDDNTYYAYLMNENNEIFEVKQVEKLGKVTEFNINKDKIYLALDDTYTPTLDYKTVGNIEKKIYYSSENEEIASVSESGVITAKKAGNTKIHIKIGNEEKVIDVISTNLIVKKPKKYNNKKKYLPCGKYNESENDLLDEILKDRVETAGYKTRAGVVEAARFLALEFPYKIRYFSENGNVATNKIDAEGRYYHQGLYLHKSRYKNVSKSWAGPKTWGCSMYSRPSKGNRPNGLDCSGFVSWVLLNGGFDVGDLGAGVSAHKDLTDFGKKTKFNASVVKSGKVKVGDLLSSGGVMGGHIAIIVGEDDKYYYVAESLWTPPNVGVVIIPYSKSNLWNRYYWVMLMDSYYKEDGNITKLWY